MKRIRYNIVIKGLKDPPGNISIVALRDVLNVIIDGSGQALRFAICGESTKQGRVPPWLKNSVDFIVSGIRRGSTTIVVEAPTLRETASDQLEQQDLWFSMPNPDDTAISLFAKSVSSTMEKPRGEDYYDKSLLNTILETKDIFEKYAHEINVQSETKKSDGFVLQYSDLDRIEKLKSSLPDPQAVVISGKLDTIRHSKRRFRLVVPENQDVEGVVDPDEISEDEMREFWGKQVTVKGMLHFRVSGQPRLLEADLIKPFEKGEELFQTIPAKQLLIKEMDDIRRKYQPEKVLQEIWGKWPGDESVEEILEEIRRKRRRS